MPYEVVLYTQEGIEMERYLVFSGDEYYPHGGWKDFDWSFDTPESATDHLLSGNVERLDWW